MNKIAITVAQLEALATVSPKGFTVRTDGTVIKPEDQVQAYACATSLTKDYVGVKDALKAVELVESNSVIFSAIGGWMNDDGELCVEPVMLLPKRLFSLAQAVAVAEAQSQQAIFDLELWREIRMNEVFSPVSDDELVLGDIVQDVPRSRVGTVEFEVANITNDEIGLKCVSHQLHGYTAESDGLVYFRISKGNLRWFKVSMMPR